MNELQVITHNNVEVVDSREVAKMVEKNHYDLLRDIKRWSDILTKSTERNFAVSDFFVEHSYKDNTGRKLPCYLLTKKGCDMVANKMTGEKGVLFTAAYVTAFENMRTELDRPKLPKDFPSALRMLADATEQNMVLMAENAQQAQIIADFEPMKQYIDTILSSPGTMKTSQIAADYSMSAQALNKILHEAGIQRKVGDQRILYKSHMGKGYTSSETFQFHRSNGMTDAKVQTVWTQKGRLLIHEILTKRGISAVMDQEKAS